MHQLIDIAVGAFTGPAFMQPDQSVWTDNKHAWISLRGEMRTAGPPPHI